MRTKTLLLLLSAVATVTGCAPEDATVPFAPPELAVAGDVPVTDSTTDDDDLVCEWGPAEGQDGVWELLCYRANDSASSGLCWYIVTYRCTKGICVWHSEQLLGCDGGEETECDDEIQGEIHGEYDSGQPHGGHGQLPPASPDCEDIEHHTSNHSMATNFRWGELNGYFQDGNPHSANGGGWGWVQGDLPSGLQTLRDDWAADSLGGVYGPAVPLSSGYRCPHGNASIPNAFNDSWHMAGLAADISVRTIAGRHPNWGGFDAAQKDAKYKEVWDKLHDLSDDVNQSGISSYDNYDDRHFHIRFQ